MIINSNKKDLINSTDTPNIMKTTRSLLRIPIVPVLLLAGFALAMLGGCGAHSPSLLKDQRSIHISVFKNETAQYALEERLTRSMIQAFQRDGQLQVVSQSSADLQMEGVITEAKVTPMARTDLDRAVGYNITVTLMVTVLDTATGHPLMKDRPFSAQGTFILTNEPTFDRSQDVTDNLSEQVLSALIEGW